MSSALHEEPSAKEGKVGIMPSHSITLDIPGAGSSSRPPNISHMSTPAYESPLRHHRRKPSTPRRVKETTNARSEYTNSQDDGTAIHRINQYIIKQEIGRGSFGAVHLAVDQHDNEFAVKEFSKSRLRKRAQSNILRRPHGVKQPGHLAAGVGFNSPMHRRSASHVHDQEEGGNPLYLIKEEIAIMKKLDHPNLVSLIEVLDDPNEDSIYMVLEMCKKGVVMKVGVNDRSDPYDTENCRCWFRDMILGIEYLHAQGVVHRDIKPDNCLLTDDDVLKIVDFGVSEMFEKQSDMLTAKSAGSPAFLPPELCVSKHGGISGKAADIWSMGVTLFCLRFGYIPFEKPGVLDLYESIKHDEVNFEMECEEDFMDLMHKVLEKDPSKRITMDELREHSWVTKGGIDPLLSAEENTANLVEPPTEEELNSAITGTLSNLLVVMKAVKKFKSLLTRRRPELVEGVLGRDTRIVQPPLSIFSSSATPMHHRARSVDTDDRRPIEQVLVAEGVHRKIDIEGMNKAAPDKKDSAIAIQPIQMKSGSFDHPKRKGDAHPEAHRALTSPASGHPGKGHAHNPLEEHLFLHIGLGDEDPPDPPWVSESPPASDVNIYETAYHEEIERIRLKQGSQASIYLTRRVEKNKEYQDDPHLIGRDQTQQAGFAGLLRKIRDKKDKKKNGESTTADKLKSNDEEAVIE